MVCSLETSSQLARPGVNCGLSGDVLTPPPLMSMVKTEDPTFGLLEEDSGFAVCCTTQLSLVVQPCARRSKLQNRRSWQRRRPTQGRMLTSAALLLCASLPLSLRLDMLHRTCPLPRYSPRAVYERSNIQMQGAWHSSIEEIVRSSGTQAPGKSSHRRATETCAQSPC